MDNQSCTNLSILFVDDEQNILSSITRELHAWAKDKGIELRTALSGAQALEMLRETPHSYAIVVSDLRMPEMKGSDLLVAIHTTWPDIVTILLTGFSEIEEVMKAVKAGIFSYMLKPWNGDYLKAELEKALETYGIRAQNREYQKRLSEELKWAGEMQKTLLRPVPLTLEGMEFRSSYRPTPGLFCGGDYYDVINLNKSRYLILVGDVAGHGVRGALITAMLKSIIFPEYVRNALASRFSTADFLSWLNDRMNQELTKASNMLIAFCALVLDRKELTLTYSNAGLPHPLLKSGARVRELPISGSAIGFAKSVLYKESEEALEVGDILLAFTDGLTEIDTGEGNVVNPPVASLLEGIPSGPDLHKRLLEQVLASAKATDFSDDLAMVSAHIV